MIALDEVMDELGATRVVPKSHLWPDMKTEAKYEQTAPVTMKSGDVLIYSGKTIHVGLRKPDRGPLEAGDAS